MTDIEKLKEQLNKLSSYPERMKKINLEIKGRAFFPGGKGTFANDEIISNKEIMILGQDFDTQKKYEVAKANGGEDVTKNKTWKNLLSFLEQTKIQPENCFFTNAIMGVRLTDIATGESPAFKDKEFIGKCQDFFLFQLQLQKPKAVFALGLQVAKFLSDTSNDLSYLKKIDKFASIDIQNKQILEKVKFKNGIESTLVFLMHPSARTYNLNNRQYMEMNGAEAQIKMVKDAILPQ